MPKDKPHFDILGKDFLTVAEAAHYCCMKKTKFYADVAPRVPSHDFFGKRVFRLSDLRGLMEKAPLWQRSPNVVRLAPSTGMNVSADSRYILVPQANGPSRRYFSQGKPNSRAELTEEERHAINAAERARRREEFKDRQGN